MVEGRSSRDFPTIKGLAQENPAALEHLLDTVAAALEGLDDDRRPPLLLKVAPDLTDAM